MKFAFILMGDFDSGKDRTSICDGQSQMIGVSSIDEACTIAQQMADDGVRLVELCGAFGEDGAKKVIEATDNRIGVGYVVHLPQQDDIFRELFPSDYSNDNNKK